MLHNEMPSANGRNSENHDKKQTTCIGGRGEKNQSCPRSGSGAGKKLRCDEAAGTIVSLSWNATTMCRITKVSVSYGEDQTHPRSHEPWDGRTIMAMRSYATTSPLLPVQTMRSQTIKPQTKLQIAGPKSKIGTEIELKLVSPPSPL